MSSWHVDSAGTDRLKGHVSLFPAEIPPFVFSNELTITLPRIFRLRYWAILKLWLLNNAAHTGANEQARPIYTLWAHRLTCAHKRTHTHVWSAEAKQRLCERLLLNRSITFSSNDNDITRPFICGGIHVDSNPLCSFSYCIFEWFMPCSLIIHYFWTTAERGEMNKMKNTNVFLAVLAGTTKKESNVIQSCSLYFDCFKLYEEGNCFVCLLIEFSASFETITSDKVSRQVQHKQCGL